MQQGLNRRRFLGLTLVSSVAVGSGPSLAGVLYGPEGERRVGAILAQHLRLGVEHRELVREFSWSLAHRPAHTASPEASRAILAGKEGPEVLERYVVQEFIAGTNYRVWIRGKTQQLQLAASLKRAKV